MPPIMMPIPIAMCIVMVVPVVVYPLHVRIGESMAACSCGCEIGAANNAAGVPTTSTAVARVLRINLRIGAVSSLSAGTITR